MARRVRDIDRGWKKLQKLLSAQAVNHVAVGFVGSLAAAQHGDDGITVAEVALTNEFGETRTSKSGTPIVIPARSMVRAAFDRNRPKYEAMTARLAPAIVRGQITVEQALDALGVAAKADVVKRINDGVPPPNAPSTIRRKGSSHTLIDQGQLKASATYEKRKD
jgi:hypothetical protein